jgi:hypothetical protein
MNQLNMPSSLIQDIDFVDTQAETTVVGGLTIACRPIHLGDGDGIIWGGCFPHPRPLPHPRPFPIDELPFPRPQPWPKHPPIALDAVS